MASYEETTAIAVIEEKQHNEVDLYPQMAMSLDVARAQLKALREFVSEILVPGEDYGIIPGTAKPTLLKPGAEKLCEVYALTPEVEIIDKVEDWHARPPFFHYTVKVRLVSRRSGKVMGEGIGSCNSRESRFADRWMTEKQARDQGIDTEGLPSKEFDGKYGKYRKVLVVNEDTPTLVNTIQKMAEKRALVSATLKVTRASAIFTQDLEDIKGLDPDAPLEVAQKAAQKPPQAANGKATTPPTTTTAQKAPTRPAQEATRGQNGATNGSGATPAQVRAIYNIVRNRGLDEAGMDERCKAAYGVPVSGLTRAQASEVISRLNEGQLPPVPEKAKPETVAPVIEGEVVGDVDPIEEAPGAWFWEPLDEAGFERAEVRTLLGDLSMYNEKDLKAAHSALLDDAAVWQFLAARGYSRSKAVLEAKRKGHDSVADLAQAIQEAELGGGS